MKTKFSIFPVALILSAGLGVGFAAPIDNASLNGPNETAAASSGQRFDLTADPNGAVSVSQTPGKNAALTQLKATAGASATQDDAGLGRYVGIPRNPGESFDHYMDRATAYNVAQDPDNPHNPRRFWRFAGAMIATWATMAIVGTLLLPAAPTIVPTTIGVAVGLAVYHREKIVRWLKKLF